MNLKLTLSLCLIMFTLILQGQNIDQKAKQHIVKHAEAWNLEKNDISDMIISDQYLTKHNGVTHTYFIQRYKGIPIYNAVTGIHVDKHGKSHDLGHGFISNIANKVNTTSPSLSAREALVKSVEYLDISNAIIPVVISPRDGISSVIFEKTNFSNSPIEISLFYVADKLGNLKLAWDLAIDQKSNADYWNLRIDAQSGEVLDKNNFTTYCNFGDHVDHECHADRHGNKIGFKPTSNSMLGTEGSYRVFPLPAESPIHGNLALVVNPADALSSPRGWHDVSEDGSGEYTITRGNNVHAYLDRKATNSPSEAEPDGGKDHIFDFGYDPNLEPYDKINQPLAVTNLFYMNNMVHDITYAFGFDEEAGNFQTNNWNKGGRQGDEVKAEAQDNSGSNNANFSTPRDGGSGRMQMFLWANTTSHKFEITAPDSLSGSIKTLRAGFGPDVPDVAIEAEMVIADDGSRANPTRGCIDNFKKQDVEGKIVIIDRGTCEFSSKTVHAQNAGAVAVLVCFFDESNFSMGAGQLAGNVRIPAFSANKSVCDRFKIAAGKGLKAKISKPVNSGPSNFDGDLDNGIIAHEYGHGISNRLTGGPSLAGCLGNGEQMGEGWSDFFALIMTTKEGDKGETARGIGNFATGREPNDGGIRPLPYSTNMSINNHTYFSARTVSIPHGLGAVWCQMIWDVYWALVDEYGFSEDFRDATAGNNIAIQLVMDGMKLQTCQPGFIDGRDAILMADSINNGGANSCLIWKAFARRGLGWGASQGTSTTIGDADEKESFEVPPTCQNRIRIDKSVTAIVMAGEDIDVLLKIANNRNEKSTKVIVIDIIPDNCTYKKGSASIEPSITGNTLTWDLGEMNSLLAMEISYKLSTDFNNYSTLSWEETVINDLDPFDVWLDDAIKGDEAWDIEEEVFQSPSYCWSVRNRELENDQHLYLRESIKLTESRPAIRFSHLYNTQSSAEGLAAGTVELSVDGGPWEVATDKFVYNGFDGALPYGTFVEPDYAGFYGLQEEFKTSYIDLAEFQGKDININFRFGTPATAEPFNFDTVGWYVDDIQIIDMISYNAESCISAENITGECISASGVGTIVDVEVRDATNDPIDDVRFNILPTPASDFVLIDMKATQRFEGVLSLVDVNGKILRYENIENTLHSSTRWNVKDLSSGMYIVQLKNGSSVTSQKIIVKHK